METNNEKKKPGKTPKVSKEYTIKEPESIGVEEPFAAYNPVIDYNRHYTYADYMSWLDDKMRELIGGIARLMSAPNTKHATVSGEMFYSMSSYIKKRKGNCKVFHAPFDVRLPKRPEDIRDDKIDTVVQPDICVICDLSKIDERGCIGAPDMVVEVLSPSSRQYDYVHKREKYESSGVKEYWVVAPLSKTVDVFILQSDGKYGKATTYEKERTEFISVQTLPGLKLYLKEIFE